MCLRIYAFLPNFSLIGIILLPISGEKPPKTAKTAIFAKLSSLRAPSPIRAKFFIKEWTHCVLYTGIGKYSGPYGAKKRKYDEYYFAII